MRVPTWGHKVENRTKLGEEVCEAPFHPIRSRLEENERSKISTAQYTITLKLS